MRENAFSRKAKPASKKSATDSIRNKEAPCQYCPGTLSGQVVVLQRAAGNFAVSRLLTQRIQREDDNASVGTIPSELLDVGHRPLRSPTFEGLPERLAQRFRFSGIHSMTLDGFEVNEAELTNDHRDAIDENGPRFRSLVNRYPDGVVVVTGYCDLTGPTRDPIGFNQRLGMLRAEAVATALSRYVPRSAIRTYSGGWHRPVIAEEGYHPANRRVEIVFRRLTIGETEPLTVGEVALPSEIGTSPLFPTTEELLRISDDPSHTPQVRELARIMSEMPLTEEVTHTALEDYAERIRRRIEIRTEDYIIRPDLETILSTLRIILDL
jgi:outer membrane protein OmpA-like peptidoglycan-associated protein